MDSNFRPKVRLTDDVMYLVNKQLENSIKRKTRSAVNQYDIANHEEYRRQNPEVGVKFENSVWFRCTKVTIVRGPKYLTELEKAVMNRSLIKCALEVNDELIEELIRPRVDRSLEWRNFNSVARSVEYYWQKCKWPRVPNVPFIQLPETLLDESESSLLLDLTVDKGGKKLLVVERLLKCVQEWEVIGGPMKRAPDVANWRAILQKKEYRGRGVLFALWLFLYLIPRVSGVPTDRTSFYYDSNIVAYIDPYEWSWTQGRFPRPDARHREWKFVFTWKCRFNPRYLAPPTI